MSRIFSPVISFLRKSVLLHLIFIAGILPITSGKTSFAETESQSRLKTYIIGSLHTDHHLVTILSGQKGIAYTVYSKSGKLLAEEIRIDELIAAFPVIGKTVSTGIAGNDARLLKSHDFSF
jgi:uncharacterized protein YbaP (TraB family)